MAVVFSPSCGPFKSVIPAQIMFGGRFASFNGDRSERKQDNLP
ncbi:MAG: hypothetical protein AAF829_10010 [Pseudomonadota bacterium]